VDLVAVHTEHEQRVDEGRVPPTEFPCITLLRPVPMMRV
jgi:hypothetical protein